MFCNVSDGLRHIENVTLPNLYEAPLRLEEAGLARVVCRGLGLDDAGAGSCPSGARWWRGCTARAAAVRIGLVGKYVRLHDAYLSVAEALRHAGLGPGRERLR